MRYKIYGDLYLHTQTLLAEYYDFDQARAWAKGYTAQGFGTFSKIEIVFDCGNNRYIVEWRASAPGYQESDDAYFREVEEIYNSG